MKTTIQDLMEELDELRKTSDSVSVTDIQRMLFNQLKKEKQQIIEAYNEGSIFHYELSAEYYYMNTFNTSAE